MVNHMATFVTSVVRRCRTRSLAASPVLAAAIALSVPPAAAAQPAAATADRQAASVGSQDEGSGVPPAARAVASPEYRVGVRDVMVVTLWDQMDLSGRFRISPDGTFNFPMIGRVPAAGLTLGEIEKRLRTELENGYFRNPQLSLSVEEYGSQQFFVVGEVRQPGPVTLTRRMTLMEALARAGSTTPEASGEVIILRPREGEVAPDAPVQADQPGVTEVLRVDLRALQNGTAPNAVVRDGDTVVVPRAETLFVLGQVRSPGGYPFKRGTTVLQALSLAGGVTDRGAIGRVKIVRIVSGQKRELKIKVTDLVQAGDTIVVPEKYF
jgi:polysaccharide biosynthesis/export protein